MKVDSLVIFSLLAFSRILGTLSQCFDYPNPLNRTYKISTTCPMEKQQKSIKFATSYSQQSGENMFLLTFTCGIPDVALCDKAKNAFESAGKIISSTLQLNTPINLNASFLDFCKTLGECPKGGFVTLGGATPARTIPLQDNDGLVRLYPQALVKQFQFKQHPSFGPFDITALFNAVGASYWFEGDPPISREQQDFLYVAIHEMIHGLGFASGWEDYVNETPEALTPEISISGNPLKQFMFEGFLESAFDRHIIHIPTGKRLSAFTGELNKFQNAFGVNFQSDIDFITKFRSSPQYQLAKEVMSYSIVHNTLGFLPRGTTKADDAIILETGLVPYQPGSSVSHVDFKTYNNTIDFLMKYLADHGADLKTLIAIRNGNNYGEVKTVISPKLKLILETIGYSTPDYTNPYKPSVTIIGNNFDPTVNEPIEPGNANEKAINNSHKKSNADVKTNKLDFWMILIVNLLILIIMR
ncbi:10278_t:CDS:2 [Funneliformis caledonium]|uniref:10278_t:CDS:1 n=1 Tax=Funneliformis caledonium TaxID=1117310 RepID=A0A9N8ZYT3_9GLOM|nr:10278_t:CDS:2 [Funneliformis caledonium]